MSNYKETLSDLEQLHYKLYLDILKEIVKNNLEDAKVSVRNGFYTLFAEDAKEAGYDILNVFNSDLNGFFDVFLKKHPKETNNWEQVRIQASIAAMQGICASPVNVIGNEIALAEESVKFADALVKELKGE